MDDNHALICMVILRKKSKLSNTQIYALTGHYHSCKICNSNSFDCFILVYLTSCNNAKAICFFFQLDDCCLTRGTHTRVYEIKNEKKKWEKSLECTRCSNSVLMFAQILKELVGFVAILVTCAVICNATIH